MFNSASLVASVSPPLDGQMTQALVEEFLNVERRFVLGDWEPATLDGGQFAEIAARLVYHIDSGNLNRRKGLNQCLSYVEDQNNSNNHSFPQRRTALHLSRVLRTLYKFRSQRGAVHIDPDYTANELDSTLVVSLVRWLMAEILRVFWVGDTALVARAIREIIRFEVPAVLAVDGKPLVLRTDCTADEELLLLLHNAGEAGMSRSQIGSSIPKSAATVTRAIQKLASADRREIVKFGKNRYQLTPNGARRVHEDLADKLTIQ